MNNNYESLNNFTAAELAKAAVTKLYAKKQARLITGGIAAVAAWGSLEYLYSTGYDGFWWVYALKTLIFTVFVMSIAVFISNIGRFSKRKFIAAASVTTALLWAAVPTAEVYAKVNLDYPEFIPQGILRRHLVYLPVFLVALGIVLFLGILVARKKRV